MILWRSDLAHCGAAPLAPGETFRAVAYAAMQPACLAPRLPGLDDFQVRNVPEQPLRVQWRLPSLSSAAALSFFFFGTAPSTVTLGASTDDDENHFHGRSASPF